MYQVKLLHPNAKAPAPNRAQDAGMDLRCVEDFELGPGERKLVATGIAISLPIGVAALLIPRSGLAAKYGITVVNSPGLIDPSYRGEVKAILLNTSKQSFKAEAGDRICQLLITSYLNPEFQLVEELAGSEDERGEAGFGSSGLK